MSKTYFISFSGSVGEQNSDLVQRQKLLSDSAYKNANVDNVISWTRSELLNSDFYRQNKRILDQPRGAGFWSWKPYIVLQTLNQIGKKDWVVYSDIGKPFRRGDTSRAGNHCIGNMMTTPVDPMIAYAEQHNGFTPGIWIPHYGSAKVWTKRDCFVGMGCDSPKYHNSGQVQAGYSCWSNSKESRDFLTQWLYWCQVEAVISDNTNLYGKPNFPEFRDHRHDQSIMTNLVLKNNIQLFGPQDQSLAGFRDFNLILRHMALAGQLNSQSKTFELLFNDNNPILSKMLKQALELWLLPELRSQSKILVQSNKNQKEWLTSLPECRFDFSEQISGINNNEFTAIFTDQCNGDNSATSLADCYESLTPGGILVIGPFDGSKEVSPLPDGTFDQLLQWIFINQRFPSNVSTAQNQRPHSITVGNAQNPLITSINNKQCHVIFRKPHMQIMNK